MIIKGWKEPIYGVTVKNVNYYVIRDKETHEFDARDGELVQDIMEANWYPTYRLAQESRTCFDEPERFEIILMNCTTRLEDVLS